MKEIDLLTTELSGVLPKEEILEAYNYVMNKDPNNRNNFLFVDFNSQEAPSQPVQDELHGLGHSLLIIKVGVRTTRLGRFLHFFKVRKVTFLHLHIRIFFCKSVKL